MSKRVLSVTDTAETLGVSRPTVYTGGRFSSRKAPAQDCHPYRRT